MPVIPIIQDTISTDVPGVDLRPRGSGVLGDAYASLGQGLADSSMGLLREMKEAEAKDAAFREKADDMLTGEDFVTELKMKNPTGYVTDEKTGEFVTNADGTRRTITQEYRDWANERFTKKQEKMPSERARQLYYEEAGAYYTNSKLSLRREEDVLKAKYFDEGQVSNLQKFSDNLVSRPDVNKTYEFSNSIMGAEMAQVGATRSTVIASENARRYNQQLAESTMNGMYNQVLSQAKSGDKGFNRSNAIAYARGVLKGEDLTSKQRKEAGLPTIAEMLDPDRKAAIDEKFIRLAELAKDLDLSDLRRKRDEIKAALASGRPARVNLAEFDREVKEAVAGKKITDFEAASDFYSDVSVAAEIGRLTGSKFALQTPAERAAEVPKAGARVYGSAQKAIGSGQKIAGSLNQVEVESKIGGYAQSLLSKEQSDFAAYLAEHDPVSKTATAQLDFSKPETFAKKSQFVRQSLQQIDTYYARHFPGNDRYKRLISKGNAKILGTSLMDNNRSVEQRTEAVVALKAAYGDRYAEVMDQVIRDGHLDEGWRSAAIGDTREEIQSSVGSLVGKKDLDKNFEVVAQSKGITDRTLDDEIARKLGPYIQAMSQRNPNDPRAASVVSQRVSEIRTKTKQLLLDTPNLSEADAVKRAGDSLLFDKYHFTEVGGGWFSGTEKNLLVLPKRVGEMQINELERDRIVEYAQSHLKADALKALGIVAPPSPAGKASPFGDKFHEQAASTGRFQTAPNERGLEFRWYNRQTGRYEKGLVKDSKGQLVPFFVPFSKAVLPEAKPVDKSLEAVKPPVFRGDGR